MGVINRISVMFQGHPDLIEGFHNLVLNYHVGHKIHQAQFQQAKVGYQPSCLSGASAASYQQSPRSTQDTPDSSATPSVLWRYILKMMEVDRMRKSMIERQNEEILKLKLENQVLWADIQMNAQQQQASPPEPGAALQVDNEVIGKSHAIEKYASKKSKR